MPTALPVPALPTSLPVSASGGREWCRGLYGGGCINELGYGPTLTSTGVCTVCSTFTTAARPAPQAKAGKGKKDGKDKDDAKGKGLETGHDGKGQGNKAGKEGNGRRSAPY
eukprot:g12021.t1